MNKGSPNSTLAPNKYLPMRRRTSIVPGIVRCMDRTSCNSWFSGPVRPLAKNNLRVSYRIGRSRPSADTYFPRRNFWYSPSAARTHSETGTGSICLRWEFHLRQRAPPHTAAHFEVMRRRPGTRSHELRMELSTRPVMCLRCCMGPKTGASATRRNLGFCG